MNRHTLKLQPRHWVNRLLQNFVQADAVLAMRRRLKHHLPFVPLQSDLQAVQVFSWLADAKTVQKRFPEMPLIWQQDGKTIFSILNYQHRYFGPKGLGQLRKLCPSPLQSTWRFYCDAQFHPHTVIIEQVIVSHWFYVWFSRLMSDVMPAQFGREFLHRWLSKKPALLSSRISLDDTYYLYSVAEASHHLNMPASWQTLFASPEQAIQFLFAPHRALSSWVDQPYRVSQSLYTLRYRASAVRGIQLHDAQFPAQFLREIGADPDSFWGLMLPKARVSLFDETRLRA